MWNLTLEKEHKQAAEDKIYKWFGSTNILGDKYCKKNTTQIHWYSCYFSGTPKFTCMILDGQTKVFCRNYAATEAQDQGNTWRLKKYL